VWLLTRVLEIVTARQREHVILYAETHYLVLITNKKNCFVGLTYFSQLSIPTHNSK